MTERPGGGDHMHADDLESHGAVGAENQLTTIADALVRFDADLIALRLHVPGAEHENWREHRIAEKVRARFDVRTVVFYFDSGGSIVERQEAGASLVARFLATAGKTEALSRR